MGTEILFGVMECSGTRKWRQLHSIRNVLNVTESTVHFKMVKMVKSRLVWESEQWWLTAGGGGVLKGTGASLCGDENALKLTMVMAAYTCIAKPLNSTL